MTVPVDDPTPDPSAEAAGTGGSAPDTPPAPVVVNVTTDSAASGRPQRPRKSSGTAYGLWALSLIGVAGIQHFYLGKVGRGIFYLLTAGVFFIGTLIDLFTLSSQVRTVNAWNGHTSR